MLDPSMDSDKSTSRMIKLTTTRNDEEIKTETGKDKDELSSRQFCKFCLKLKGTSH